MVGSRVTGFACVSIGGAWREARSTGREHNANQQNRVWSETLAIGVNYLSRSLLHFKSITLQMPTTVPKRRVKS